jgi:hypothetical protein
MTTTDRTPASPDASFAEELARLKVKGGDAEPGRAIAIAGIVAFVVGVVLIVFSLQTAHTTADPLVQGERTILALLGALVGLAGVVVWARFSLSRHLRYWLLRIIFEERLQQDRAVTVLERIDEKLGRDR